MHHDDPKDAEIARLREEVEQYKRMQILLVDRFNAGVARHIIEVQELRVANAELTGLQK